jgi:hypothetical protein
VQFAELAAEAAEREDRVELDLVVRSPSVCNGLEDSAHVPSQGLPEEGALIAVRVSQLLAGRRITQRCDS